MPVDPASLTILRYPAPTLRQPAAPIEQITDEVRAVARRMLELMHEADGLGLAAPQVGLAWRMFVTRGPRDGEPDRVFINPQVTPLGRESVLRDEGCLSLPGITAEILRPTAAEVTAQDLRGTSFTVSDDGLHARVWQHEYDHLEGKLIIDRMRPLDRLANRKAVKELEAAARPVLGAEPAVAPGLAAKPGARR